MTGDENVQLRELWPTVLANWRRFWFKPEPAYPLGLARLGFGALTTVWALGLLPRLFSIFGPNEGILPRSSREFNVSVLNLSTNNQMLFLTWLILILSAIAVTLGWHTRVASLLVFAIVYSFVNGYREAFNAGDVVLGIEALVFALSSSGAALSLDQRRNAGSFWSAQIRAPWARRLMQVELSLIYLVAVQTKLTGSTWVDGTAVSYALQWDLNDSVFPVPHWLYNGTLVVNLMTWGTLLIELALGVLVWNRSCRPWVLLAGIVMHSMISLVNDVAIFSFAMFVMYCAFIPPETLEKLPDTIRGLRDRPAWRRLTAKPTTGAARQSGAVKPQNVPCESAVGATDTAGSPSTEFAAPSTAVSPGFPTADQIKSGREPARPQQSRISPVQG